MQATNVQRVNGALDILTSPSNSTMSHNIRRTTQEQASQSRDRRNKRVRIKAPLDLAESVSSLPVGTAS